MQTLANSAAIEPVIICIAGIAVVLALGLWLLHSAHARRNAGDPLAGLFDPSQFDQRLESITQRPVVRHSRRIPPLHGQRAQMARLRELWALDARTEALDDIARVMRAGKGRQVAPIRVTGTATVVEDSEWEEVRMLPPPPASQAA